MTNKDNSALRANRRLAMQTHAAANPNSIAAQVAAGTYRGAVAVHSLTPGEPPASSPLLNPSVSALGYDDLPDYAQEFMRWLEDEESTLSLAESGYVDKLHGAVSLIPGAKGAFEGKLEDGLFARLGKAKEDYAQKQDYQYNYRVDLTKDERGIHFDAGLRQAADTIRALENAIADTQRQQAMLRAKLSPVRKLLENLRKFIVAQRRSRKPFLDFAKDIRCSASTIALCEDDRMRMDESIKTIENAPPSASEVKANAEADINAMAARGKIAIDRDGHVEWPTNADRLELFGTCIGTSGPIGGLSGFAVNNTHDALPIVVNLFRKEILQNILASVPAGGMSTSEKTKKLALLRADKLDCERRECALIEQNGRLTAYRHDTDARAALQLAD